MKTQQNTNGGNSTFWSLVSFRILWIHNFQIDILWQWGIRIEHDACCLQEKFHNEWPNTFDTTLCSYSLMPCFPAGILQMLMGWPSTNASVKYVHPPARPRWEHFGHYQISCRLELDANLASFDRFAIWMVIGEKQLNMFMCFKLLLYSRFTCSGVSYNSHVVAQRNYLSTTDPDWPGEAAKLTWTSSPISSLYPLETVGNRTVGSDIYTTATDQRPGGSAVYGSACKSEMDHGWITGGFANYIKPIHIDHPSWIINLFLHHAIAMWGSTIEKVLAKLSQIFQMSPPKWASTSSLAYILVYALIIFASQGCMPILECETSCGRTLAHMKIRWNVTRTGTVSHGGVTNGKNNNAATNQRV